MNCNFTKSGLITAPVTSITISGGYFTGLTTTQSMSLATESVSIENVVFQNCFTTTPLMALIATVDEALIDVNTVTFNNCNTSSTNSIFLLNSKNGEEISASLSTLTYTNCNSGAAFLEVKNDPSSVAFYAGATLNAMTATGGSTKTGAVVLTNSAPNSDITITANTISLTGVNFNSAAVFYLSASSLGTAFFSGQEFFNNAICSPTGMSYLARCVGNTTNLQFNIAGYNEGTNSVDGCLNSGIDTSPECGV
jgi:hypothetical protein